MKRYGFAAAAIVVAVAGCAQMRAMTGGGWETLVDGDKGLENFSRVGDANWRAEGGAIVADRGKGGHLVSNKTYGDFEIRAEFWAETDTNSGIFIRCNDRTKITAVNCYEVNIWDIRPEPKYGTGAPARSSTSPRCRCRSPTRPAAAGTPTRSPPRDRSSRSS